MIDTNSNLRVFESFINSLTIQFGLNYLETILQQSIWKHYFGNRYRKNNVAIDLETIFQHFHTGRSNSNFSNGPGEPSKGMGV